MKNYEQWKYENSFKLLGNLKDMEKMLKEREEHLKKLENMQEDLIKEIQEEKENIRIIQDNIDYEKRLKGELK